MSDPALSEEDLETIEIVASNGQSGRITKWEIDQLVKTYRKHHASAAHVSSIDEAGEIKTALEVPCGITIDNRELRRINELENEVDRLRNPFRCADQADWEMLFKMLPDGGHGRFWKAALTEMRAALGEEGKDG